MAELVQGQTGPTGSPAPTGVKGTGNSSDSVSRWAVFLHSVAFVLGFSLVFILLGSAAGLLGRGLNQYMALIQQLGAIMLLIFGLTTLGLFRWLVNLISTRVIWPRTRQRKRW